MLNFWQDLDKPIKVLAPMAGYTDSAFRLLCRENGADVVMTELISADAIAQMLKHAQVESRKLNVEGHKEKLISNKVICNKNQSTGDLLSFFEQERPLVVQLFGKYPEKFALATKWITENLKPDGIDINMGCPARKVVGSDHGAALIKYPKLAAEIVRAVKDNTDLPVSVKTRLGWENPDQILEFAPVLAGAGIDALIVHGRTYKQGFAGKADWDNIYKVKEMLPELVVIGNGGLESIPDIQYSKFDIPLDGFAIGQATFGQPWIFDEKIKNPISKTKLKKIILFHAKLAFTTKGELGIIEFRKHLLAYLKGFPGAKELRKEAVTITNLIDIGRVVSLL